MGGRCQTQVKLSRMAADTDASLGYEPDEWLSRCFGRSRLPIINARPEWNHCACHPVPGRWASGGFSPTNWPQLKVDSSRPRSVATCVRFFRKPKPPCLLYQVLRSPDCDPKGTGLLHGGRHRSGIDVVNMLGDTGELVDPQGWAQWWCSRLVVGARVSAGLQLRTGTSHRQVLGGVRRRVRPTSRRLRT